MGINYDIEKINRILKDFHELTGINMVLVRDDFTYINNHAICKNNGYCEKVKLAGWKPKCVCSDMELLKRCKESRKPELHICHAGLIEVAVPILYNNIPISYILFGQLKTSSDFSSVAERVAVMDLDPHVMEAVYSELTTFDDTKINSLINLASIIINYILTEKMLNHQQDEKVSKAVNYINQNLDKELSIQSIARTVNVSKSALYKCFHEHFGCTVSEYINASRIEKSVHLLTKTNLSIEDISQKCGFLSAAYYSKVFKRLKNTTPLKYRRDYQIGSTK